MSTNFIYIYYSKWMPGTNSEEVNELDSKFAPGHDSANEKGAAILANPL